jgi:3-deoxy-D-manno-octulosonic-acid transferase
MHCASLGEFEQGRPVVEALIKKYPSKKIIISFFSASGYEAAKKYQLADQILYLPFDGKHSSEHFIKYVNPEIVIWIKYEYWYWYLTILKEKKIPILLVSAHFRLGQPFFKWYGGLFKKMLNSFTQVFVQHQESASLIKDILPEDKLTISGDTRFDRVLTLRENSEALPDFINEFLGNRFCVVAGSTWPEDELQINHFEKMNPSIKLFIVPHEVDAVSIKDVQQRFNNHILYSELLAGKTLDTEQNVMIVDKIGVLSRLYKYADIAYIGGGFNESGIHNTLEAAVWGTAIVFGPVYEKFIEAKQLIELGAAKSISTPVELDAAFNEIIANKELLVKKKLISKNYVATNRGATDKILEYIQEKRLLTN